MITQEIKILATNGIHTRIAAMIVNKVAQISNKSHVQLYIKKVGLKDWLGISMLALVSLKIKCNESIIIGAKKSGDETIEALNELKLYIETVINKSDNATTSMNSIDKFIEESAIVTDQIISESPIGIIVIDLNSNIININNYASNILNINGKECIGKDIYKILPHSELPKILTSKDKELGKILYLGNKTCTINRSPLLSHDKIIGAVAVFQDVSELVGVKEVNEKLQKILASSHDLICFVDNTGVINYCNPAYKQCFSSADSEIGKNIFDMPSHNIIIQCFKDKKKIENVLQTKDGIDVMTTAEPIFIDNKFNGVISTSKPVNELKELMSKLQKSQEELDYYKDELMKHTSLKGSFKNIIGVSKAMHNILFMCEKASRTTSTVLIQGESGTGKELIASAIHNNSPRKGKPFIRVNCAAIPENLLESELFGYKKGAFTGALKHKPGKFQLADGGTIFLDEIGDMPLSMQAKLLRVLQEKEIDSLGGLKPQKIDIRVIAATNRILPEMIENGTFREDLYYRLNVVSISLPSLKDRKEDIPILVEHFISKINESLHTTVTGIDQNVLPMLCNYSWPGNIRELENIIERAINLCDGHILTARDFPSYICSKTHTAVTNQSQNLINVYNDELLPFEEYEKQIIELAMKKYKSYNKAGKALGLTHRTISLKCQKYGIDKQ